MVESIPPPKDGEFRTVKDFLHQVLELQGTGGPPDFRSPFVFRGHHDEGWQLKPSAWRPDGLSKLSALRTWVEPKIEKAFAPEYGLSSPAKKQRFPWALQTVTEVMAVRQFCSLADELGLSVPDGDKILTDANAIQMAVMGRIKRYPHAMFQKDDQFPLFVDVPFAFAQHHGIPTRYLDWTRDPLIAAYFACDGKGPDDQNRSSDRICIWITMANDASVPNIRWVTVPRGQHQYLHAQDGVFSVNTNADDYFLNKSEWPSFDQGHPDSVGARPPILAKFTLPISEAENLRKELLRRRKSKAHLMPTFDNVAATVSAQWKWLLD